MRDGSIDTQESSNLNWENIWHLSFPWRKLFTWSLRSYQALDLVDHVHLTPGTLRDCAAFEPTQPSPQQPGRQQLHACYFSQSQRHSFCLNIRYSPGLLCFTIVSKLRSLPCSSFSKSEQNEFAEIALAAEDQLPDRPTPCQAAPATTLASSPSCADQWLRSMSHAPTLSRGHAEGSKGLYLPVFCKEPQCLPVLSRKGFCWLLNLEEEF